jgi:hypothetical protein
MPQERLSLEEFRAQQQKAHKYRAKGCRVDGRWFPSQRQGRRYEELKLLVLGGTITDLQIDNRETTFRLEVNGQLVCKYRADAVYRERGKLVVEDSKGFPTEVYKLKRKLMQACLGIEIREV